MVKAVCMNGHENTEQAGEDSSENSSAAVEDALSVELFDELFAALRDAEVARRKADAALFGITAEIVELSARYSSQLNERGIPDYERLAIPPRPGMVTSVKSGVGPGRIAELAVTYHLAQELEVSEYAAAALMRRAYTSVHKYPLFHQKIASGDVPRGAVEHALDEIDKITPEVVERPLPDESGDVSSEQMAEYENEVRLAAERADGLKERLATYLDPRFAGKTAWQVKKLAENWRKRHHLKTPAAAHKVAREGRYVNLQASDDGMSYLNAYIPTVAAEALQRRLDKAVEQSRAQDRKDARTTDEIRTDAFLNLLLPRPATRREQTIQEAEGHGPEWVTDDSWLQQITANIAVLIPASVLSEGNMGLEGLSKRVSAERFAAEGTANEGSPAKHPVDEGAVDKGAVHELVADELAADQLAVDKSGLPGMEIGRSTLLDHEISRATSTLPQVASVWAEGERFGAIDPESARELARRAKVWRRLITDPLTGTIRDVDTYRPSREQREALVWRDRYCRIPGCQRPGRSCDVDHVQEFQDGGQTTLENLTLLCRKHHRLKSLGHLRIRFTENGELRVTDRFGLSVVSVPWESANAGGSKVFQRQRMSSRNEAA